MNLRLKHFFDDLLKPRGVLVDWQIRRLCVEHGLIAPYQEDHLNAASYELDYAGTILIPRPDGLWELQDAPVLHLHPGNFILASTVQTFCFPRGYAGDVKLKSTPARQGLNHALAGWVDPGFDKIKRATLTLELWSSFQTLRIVKGQSIAQIVITRCSGKAERDYSERDSHYIGQIDPREAHCDRRI